MPQLTRALTSPFKGEVFPFNFWAVYFRPGAPIVKFLTSLLSVLLDSPCGIIITVRGRWREYEAKGRKSIL